MNPGGNTQGHAARNLVDQEARRRIAEDLDATLIVEAAAGTGKTTALVERVLSLLRAGKATLGSLVAVTFTEKAAGEMKLRLRTEIEKARQRAEDAEEGDRFNQALRELEAAHIGTIHAFCADLLRERPVEARVDPLFEVLPDDEAERLYDEAFTRWFQRALANPGEGVARVLRRAHRDRDRDQDSPRRVLYKAGRALVEQRDFPTPYERPSFDRVATLDAVIETLRVLAAYAPKGASDSWLSKSLLEVERVLFEVDRRHTNATGASQEFAGVASRDYDGIEALLRTLARHRCWHWQGSGQFFNRAEGILRTEVLERRKEAQRSLEQVLVQADADLAALLFRELWTVVGIYEELKARAGKLDFLDLLLVARNVLQEDRAVRGHLQRRFSHLLVDEFQDTDPLQAEILLLLASANPDEADPRALSVRPGKLFVVGDPKQSIYRFRRADVALYESIKERLIAGGATLLHLQTSFRSAPSLQRFVNASFAPLMMGNARKSQADYVPLSPFREEAHGRPSLIALPVPRPYSEYGKIANYRIDESFADAVGAFVAWLVRESGWTISERGGGAQVPMESRHICLLFKRLQSFGADVTRPYARALEVRRIPHVLVGGRSFHEREEVLALRSVLAAIEWPDDALSVYAALHGPFFALDDEAILAFRAANQHVHPLRKRRDLTLLTQPVADALGVLATLHAGRNRRPIADTIGEFLHVTRAHAGIAIWPAGEQALANVMRVLDMARRFEQAGASSFRAFVQHLEDEAKRGGANEAPIVEDGTDGVRVMTVHKAKGLEFPVVILVDPTAPTTLREPSRYCDVARKLMAVPLGGAAPHELSSRRAELLGDDEDEAVRLLYVATTRARDLLVVPIVGDRSDDVPRGWLSKLDPAVVPRPSSLSGPKPPPLEGCPPFGNDTVLDRPPGASRPREGTIRPGIHIPQLGDDPVVVWDPAALRLGAEEDAGHRQQRILAADERGDAAKNGIGEYAAWKASRLGVLARAAEPSRNVRSVTRLASDSTGLASASESSEASKPGNAGAAHDRIVGADVTFEAVVARDERPSGKRFGILVHAALSAVQFDADAEAIAETARALGRALGASPSEISACGVAVERALHHPVLIAARRASRVEREQTIAFVRGDALVEGTLDLAYQNDDGWVVVDFKTDLVAGSRKDEYAKQVALYAEGLSRATGKPARAVVLFV